MITLDFKSIRKMTDRQSEIVQEMLDGGGFKKWCVFGRLLTIAAAVFLFKLTVLNANASMSEIISGSLLSAHLMFGNLNIAIFTLLKYRLAHGKDAFKKAKEFVELSKNNKTQSRAI